ncbi:gp53-like domain-containing protein [Pseudomonas batumici]|uniref:gp53-like domain-containing protein n=1 Tax=Pseudomonas batumici TaxID=226910 RepID=UPI003BAEC84A
MNQSDSVKYALDTGQAGAYSANYAPAIKALLDGVVLRFKAQNGNIGASTFSPNGLAAAPIVGAAHSALQGGEIVANGDVWVQWNSSIGTGSWVLVDSTGGAFQVANASKSQHAVAFGQLAAAIGTTAPQFDSSQKFATTGFLARSGKQLSGVLPFTGALTGVASHVGGFLYGWSSTANSYSLPNTVSLAIPVGAVVTLANFGSNAMTIVPQGTDKTQTPSLPATTGSFMLVPGTSAEFTHVGSGTWFITGNAVNSSSADFAASIGINGYQKLGSWIIQWGTATAIAAGGSLTVTYPLAFPNVSLMTLPGNSASVGSTANTCTVGVRYGGVSQCTFYANGTVGSPNVPWIAIGY